MFTRTSPPAVQNRPFYCRSITLERQRTKPFDSMLTTLDKSVPATTPNVSKEAVLVALLTTEQIAPLLQKTPRTVEAWRKAGLLPYLKIGRSILFDWDAVRRQLNERHVVKAH